MMFGLTKVRKLRNAITHNVIWANQKTASFVYRQVSAVFDITCFPAFALHFEEFYQYGYSAGAVAILAGAGRTREVHGGRRRHLSLPGNHRRQET